MERTPLYGGEEADTKGLVIQESTFLLDTGARHFVSQLFLLLVQYHPH